MTDAESIQHYQRVKYEVGDFVDHFLLEPFPDSASFVAMMASTASSPTFSRILFRPFIKTGHI